VDERELVRAIGRSIARRAPIVARAAPGFIARWLLRIALPLAGAATMLAVFPYYTTAGGLHLRVQGSLIAKPGISADTTIGNWQFPHVDGLPIGVHITPQNVDLLQLTDAANANVAGFTDQLQSDLNHQVPMILWWLAGETLIGVLLGLAVAASINFGVRYLRGAVRPSARAELKHRGLQLGAALGVVVLVAGFGGLTYNSRWSHQSKLTGTLGAVQLVPDQLAQYYNQQSKAFDVLNAIAGIQAQLQQQIGAKTDTAPTAYNIMYISDMHLASTYPLVLQYAENFDVKLIINTGDETEFGTSYDLTPTYLAQLSAVTAKIPMIWLAGNHDSPATVDTMRSIPGVTVLGTKTYHTTGYQVAAQYADADGLVIAGVPDPRVYGSSGAYGSDKDSVTDPLERSAVDTAVKGIAKSMQFDIFGTHEPVAAAQLRKDLPGQIRQTNAGHTHAQNASNQVQPGTAIDLVEGSTGAGGLDAVAASRPPIEFSIESVAADCQFTKIVRFQLGSSAASATGITSVASAASYGQNVVASTIYLKPQDVGSARYCSTAFGVGTVHNLGEG
jgi:hypothetical protein